MPQFQMKDSANNGGGAEGAGEVATAQARQFYYGADEQELSVASQDFDDVYAVSGQSQVLKNLRGSAPSAVQAIAS